MLKVQTHLSFLIGLVLIWSSASHAELVSAVDVNLGLTSINIKSGDYSTTLSDTSSVEINYLLKQTGASVAYVLSFAEMLRGQGLSLPYTRLGMGIRYYPMGFNGTRLIMDQDVSAQVWKATPFLGLTMGLANITVDAFNASVIEMSPRFGVELPLSENLLAQTQLILVSGTATSSPAREVSYTGITGLVGIVFLGL